MGDHSMPGQAGQGHRYCVLNARVYDKHTTILNVFYASLAKLYVYPDLGG
jgi:hypothetical protein